MSDIDRKAVEAEGMSRDPTAYKLGQIYAISGILDYLRACTEERQDDVTAETAIRRMWGGKMQTLIGEVWNK